MQPSSGVEPTHRYESDMNKQQETLKEVSLYTMHWVQTKTTEESQNPNGKKTWDLRLIRHPWISSAGLKNVFGLHSPDEKPFSWGISFLTCTWKWLSGVAPQVGGSNRVFLIVPEVLKNSSWVSLWKTRGKVEGLRISNSSMEVCMDLPVRSCYSQWRKHYAGRKVRFVEVWPWRPPQLI